MREALAIKNELETMKKQSKRRSRGKLSSPVPTSEPRLEDWYNEVDVSVSSTGSEIRRRLQETLDIRPAAKPSPQELTLLQCSYLPPEPAHFATSQTVFASYTDMMNETISRLPPLFKNAIGPSPAATAPSTPLLSNWRIPEPVLFGLGSRS